MAAGKRDGLGIYKTFGTAVGVKWVIGHVGSRHASHGPAKAQRSTIRPTDEPGRWLATATLPLGRVSSAGPSFEIIVKKIADVLFPRHNGTLDLHILSTLDQRYDRGELRIDNQAPQ